MGKNLQRCDCARQTDCSRIWPVLSKRNYHVCWKDDWNWRKIWIHSPVFTDSPNKLLGKSSNTNNNDIYERFPKVSFALLNFIGIFWVFRKWGLLEVLKGWERSLGWALVLCFHSLGMWFFSASLCISMCNRSFHIWWDRSIRSNWWDWWKRQDTRCQPLFRDALITLWKRLNWNR